MHLSEFQPSVLQMLLLLR